MITLSLLNDKTETERLFKEKNIDYNENSLCLTAVDKANVLGFSLFDITKEKMVIKYLEPLKDLSLADGILRSTLHIAAQRFIMDAYYDFTVEESVFEKLDFIKDKPKRMLNIDKLFMSCQSCKKE